MKLLIVVIHRRDAQHLTDALVAHEFRFTEMGSTGGFLRAGNVTLLIGVAADRVDAVLQVIAEQCRAREEAVNLSQADTRIYAHPAGEAIPVPVGGAQVFVLNVEQVVRI